MSPSVYGSRLILSSAKQDWRVFNKPEMKKVKRALFGPVDPKAAQKFVSDELKKITITQSEKWNFNFETGGNLSSNGQFDWRPATPSKKQRLVECSTTSLPLKKPSPVEEDIISDEYCTLPETIAGHSPMRCSPIRHEDRRVQQSRITDFMKATKRPLSVCDVSKNASSSDIPTKIRRLDVAS